MTVRKRTLLITLLIVTILIFKPSLVLTSKRIIFEALTIPLKIVKGIRRPFIFRSSYIRENFLLKEKAALLALDIARMESIEIENERLRKLLDFQENFPYKSIAAEVIGRVPSTWTNAVLINRGDKHGIKKNMAVCTSKGLIGTVIETGPFTSKVMLITDPNSRIGVILSGSGQMGVLVGTPEGICKVIYLGLDSEIKHGEKIITSGLGRVLPEKIIVGEVMEINKDMIGLYKYVTVRTDQDMNSISEVVCLE